MRTEATSKPASPVRSWGFTGGPCGQRHCALGRLWGKVAGVIERLTLSFAGGRLLISIGTI